MFLNKQRDKLRLTNRSLNRISTKWKFVIAGLVGSGTGLLILTIFRPVSIANNSSCNVTMKLVPSIRTFEGMGNLRSYDNKESSIYCQTNGCDSVTCSSIPAILDPGLEATNYIMKTFKTICPNTNVIKDLQFKSCAFPGKKLKPNWFTASLQIEKLTFDDCDLDEFLEDSFATTNFANLKILIVNAGRIRTLKKRTFEELRNLKNLLLYDNIVEEAQADLLNSIADSLEILTLDGCIINVDVLANITSHSILTKIQIVSIQRNSIGTINAKIFKSLPNVASLYIGNSKIRKIHVDAFARTSALKILDITSNQLENLPFGVFNSIFAKNPNFKISMTENPWSCDCDLKWIVDTMKHYPGSLTKIPLCVSPEENARLYFTSAKFCDNSTSLPKTTSKIDETTLTTTMTDEKATNHVKFTCRDYDSLDVHRITRRLASIDEWTLPFGYRDFFLTSLENGDVRVNLKLFNYTEVSIIWFENNGVDKTKNGVEIDCVENARGSFVLKNLDPTSTYTICLVENLTTFPNPLNCLGMKKQTVTSDDNNLWPIIGTFVVLAIVILVMSVLASYWIIRRNPSLLRGSKRIVMVRKHDVDALILPRGMRTNQREIGDNWETKKIVEPIYLTPLAERRSLHEGQNSCHREMTIRRKDSKASSRFSLQYSPGGSYVSGIEAFELYNWRKYDPKNRSCCGTFIERDEETAPPTPPLPPRLSFEPTVPSLSLAIDSNDLGHCHDVNRLFYHQHEEQQDRESMIKFIDCSI